MNSVILYRVEALGSIFFHPKKILYHEKHIEVWECRTVVECLPNMQEALNKPQVLWHTPVI